MISALYKSVHTSLLCLVEGVKEYAIFMLDLEGTVTTWNLGAERIKGWKSEEIIGSHFSRFYGKEDVDSGKPEAELLAARTTGRYTGEEWRYRKDGERFWAGITISLLRDECGREYGFSEITHDLTEKRLAEAAVTDEQARLAGVIGSAMDAIITTDEGQRITLFNPAAEAMFDRTSEEVIGQPLDILLPARFHRKIAKARTVYGIRRNGEEFPLEASISHVTIAGRMLYTVILRDITERLHAAESRDRLAAIVESSADAIISETVDGIITGWNRGAENIFGYTALEAIGKTILIIIPLELANEEADFLAQIVRGECIDQYETVRQRKDGVTINASVTISPIRDGSGAVVGASKVARDITKKKLAEKELRETEERLRLAVEGVRLGIWYQDARTGELDWSPIACSLFGLPLDSKPTAETIRALTHPDDRAIVGAALGNGNDKLSEFDFEHRIVRPDGEVRWISARARAFRNPSGEIERIGGIVFDVTDRHRSEEAFRDSEGRFLAMANSIPQLAWMAEADGSISWYNERWYQFTGTVPGLTEAFDWRSIHDPAELPKVMTRWQECINTGQPFEMVFQLRGANGKYRQFLSRVMPFKNADGKVVRWFGTNTDITEQKQAEEALRCLAQQQTLALDAAQIGWWDYDPATGTMLTDQMHRDIFGFADAEHPGYMDGYYSHFHPDDLNRTKMAIAAALMPANEGKPYTNTARIFLPDGSIRWIEFQGMAIFEGEGTERRAVRVVGAAFDITAGKKAEDVELRLNWVLEQRVAERTAQLEAANKELEAFSYSVSHDLRAPLRAVNGFASMILEDFGPQIPDEAKQYLERIRRGGERMGCLIDDLLEFSRLSRLPLNKRQVDMQALVSVVLDELNPQCEGRDIRFEVDELAPCYGDAALLKQVWTNLLSNAVKYSKGRATAIVKVGCQTVKGETVYSVQDNGAGFDMSYAHKLFGVFQRLHTADQFEGTGVGLAIVQRVVHRHGGRVWADAEVDRGATISFTLTGEGTLS